MPNLKIYECHVKGLTKLHPMIDTKHRGKFLGLSSPVMIKHIKSLGMNAVQLLPIFKRTCSYFGYDTIDWFSINDEYGTIDEFITMVDTLQSNGIKVILDVVYNHLGEGSTMSGVHFAEIDRTGCGNCIDVEKSLDTVMKSVDYWMGIVDGMRFDLAGVMGREGTGGFNPNAKFFKSMESHVSAGKILIAEPYDLHEQSYGCYPDGWIELNHHFRDTIRDGFPYTNSRDNDLNYICCHDGMVLNDLCAYNYKHNSANGELNEDGNDHNRSFNFGIEGHTYDETIINRRSDHKEWLTSQLMNCGTNILWLAGDETDTNTQFGNNNVWCQDNVMGWINWE